MGCLISALIFAGLIGGVCYKVDGPFWGILAGALVIVSGIGLSRFWTLLDREGTSFTASDFIGILAGAAFLGWNWWGGFHTHMAAWPIWYRTPSESSFLWLFWYLGGAAGFMYGFVYLTGMALSKLVGSGAWSFPLPWRRQYMPGNVDDRGSTVPAPQDRPQDLNAPEYPASSRQIGYNAPPKMYTNDEGMRMYYISGAGKNPGHTDEALALMDCCFAALGRDEGLRFLNSGARDKTLPKNIKNLYIHAAQIAER